MSAHDPSRPWTGFVSRWHLNIGGQERGLSQIAERLGGLWAVVLEADEERGIYSYVDGGTRKQGLNAGLVASWSSFVCALYEEVQVSAVVLFVRDDPQADRAFAKKMFPR